MCRLFGCRAAGPGGVAHELLHGANALRVQSREHPDGWGLGWYVDRVPQVVRSLTAAHGDDDFEEVSSFVTASTILAHIRKASIGRVSFENTHPFEWVLGCLRTTARFPAGRNGAPGSNRRSMRRSGTSCGARPTANAASWSS